jgi:hypothetical protein
MMPTRTFCARCDTEINSDLPRVKDRRYFRLFRRPIRGDDYQVHVVAWKHCGLREMEHEEALCPPCVDSFVEWLNGVVLIDKET